MATLRCICGHLDIEHEDGDWCNAKGCPCQRLEDERTFKYDDDGDDELDDELDDVDFDDGEDGV